MNALAIQALAILIAVGGLLGGGYWAGFDAASARAQTRALATERAATLAYIAEVNRGQHATATLIGERAAQDARFNALQESYNHVRKHIPLVLSNPCAPAAPAAGGGLRAAGAGVAANHVGADPALSRGAVWLWNTALAGADTPAGACGTADATEAACALDAGLTLADAWDNHTQNARLCAQDRLNHQRLIDYLKGQPTP